MRTCLYKALDRHPTFKKKNRVPSKKHKKKKQLARWLRNTNKNSIEKKSVSQIGEPKERAYAEVR